VCAGVDRLQDLDFVVALDNILDRDNGVGLCRHDRSGRDSHSRAGLELRAEGPPRGGLPGDPQLPGQIGGAHGVTVHRGARERREVDPGHDVLRADATGGGGDWNELGRQWASAFQHLLVRLFESE
jgi:hypothetical protein